VGRSIAAYRTDLGEVGRGLNTAFKNRESRISFRANAIAWIK